MSYYGNANPDLLELAPFARRVLEVGCGEGDLAAAYRSRNPQCHYVGVEIHAPAAAMAAGRLDQVLVGDIETMDDAAITGGEPFDLILMGDVLEHLRDTDAALARIARLLAPDGCFALCVPNIAHWSSLFHLMHGRWPTEDAGLFDRTHLRFFTLESITTALKKGGFNLIKQRPRKVLLDKQKAETWLPRLGDLAEQMGIDRQSFLDRSATLQYVLIARPAANPAPERTPMQIVTAAMAPRVMDVRTRLPAQQLRTIPEVNVRYQEKSVEIVPVPNGTAKIMVLQRPAVPDQDAWKRMALQALRAGWLIVTEYDDHPELVGQVLGWAPERSRWLQVAAAHAVQTTTEPLAAAFREHNPEVMVFPNAAFVLPPLRARPAGSEPKRVFYGALNRGTFGVALARALEPAIAAHPATIFEVVHDRAFFDALPTDRKNFRPTLDYDAYLEAIGACDIALLPLADDALNLFKSDLKYVESAARGAAVIASPAVYRDSVQDERTGLIAERLEDWAPALIRLLADDSLRERLSRAAWEDVRDNRMFAAQAGARIAWYRRLWEDRAQLHARLLARCPWLAEALAAPGA